MVTRRYYTPDLATRALPLVRRMAEDLREVALALQALQRRRVPDGADDTLRERAAELEGKALDLQREFDSLGIEVKDPFRGLVDFRAKRGKREVYLCWCLGEDRIGHWHELDAGFPGRQPIETF